jgi:Tfp pilus assembly protein PilZ
VPPKRGPMRKRNALRLIPRSAVTVVIENQGLPRAFGVIANISDAGACIWTTGAFQVGESLVLRLTFAREAQPFQAAGRVVWGDAGRNGGAALCYGLEWAHRSGPHHARLKGLIHASG